MMDILIYFSVVVLGLYLLVTLIPALLFFFAGSRRNTDKMKYAVSIIVAARNEENNIEDCLHSLTQQQYDGKWEIIVADDHSEDRTTEIIRRFSANEKVKLIGLPDGMKGKKSAIAEAVRNATGEILLFTDADCVMDLDWMKNMIAPFANEKVQLTSGGVKFKEKYRMNLFYPEQIGLQLISAGTMMLGFPTLISGANYGCRKELLEQNTERRSDLVSGDDIAALEVAHRKGKVVFVKSREAIVRTNAAVGWKNNVLQRARWVSKTGQMGSDLMRFTGLVVFFANLVVPLLIASVFIQKSVLSIGAFCLYSKIAIDVLLLSLAVPFFREPAVLLVLLLSEICYPFVTLAAMIKGFTGRIEWKGRKWNR